MDELARRRGKPVTGEVLPTPQEEAFSEAFAKAVNNVLSSRLAAAFYTGSVAPPSPAPFHPSDIPGLVDHFEAGDNPSMIDSTARIVQEGEPND